MAIFTFVVGCILSYQKLYKGMQNKILGLLADKIFFSSTLIVLADLKVVSVILVAWVIGVVFVHSGIDLLQRSLQVGTLDLGFSWTENLIHMGFVLIVLIISSLQGYWDGAAPRQAVNIISYSWFFFTAFLLIRSLFSEKFQKMIKES
jgi:phosphatidylglycerophosphate synthase